MIPIPQYPLYTASISLYNGTPVPYFLVSMKIINVSYVSVEVE